MASPAPARGRPVVLPAHPHQRRGQVGDTVRIRQSLSLHGLRHAELLEESCCCCGRSQQCKKCGPALSPNHEVLAVRYGLDGIAEVIHRTIRRNGKKSRALHNCNFMWISSKKFNTVQKAPGWPVLFCQSQAALHAGLSPVQLAFALLRVFVERRSISGV